MPELNTESIEVSVCCITYNQANYIEDTLRGILSQKTSFRTEILIHDDASTDGTKEILERYARKYPKIKIFSEQNNQYGKGDWYIDTTLLSSARGRFIALCEGDDVWIDNNKLQIQYDYMTEHSSVSLYTHAAQVIDGMTGEDVGILGMGDEFRWLTARDIITQWALPTASFFIRTESFIKYKKEWSFITPVGDFPWAVYLATKGDVVFDPTMRSLYRFRRPGAWSSELRADGNVALNRDIQWIAMLDSMDAATGGNYHSELVYNARKKVIKILSNNYNDKTYLNLSIGRDAYRGIGVSGMMTIACLRLLHVLGFDVERTGWMGSRSWRLVKSGAR